MSSKLTEVGQYWPAKKAASYLGYSTTTLRTWAIEGRIKALLSPGGKYRYDVQTFLEVASAASSARLSSEAKKLKAKQEKLARLSAAKKKARMDDRRKLAASQNAAKPAAPNHPADEPPLPF